MVSLNQVKTEQGPVSPRGAVVSQSVEATSWPIACDGTVFENLRVPVKDAAVHNQRQVDTEKPASGPQTPLLEPQLLVSALRESTRMHLSTLNSGIDRLELSSSAIGGAKVVLGLGLLAAMTVDLTNTLGAIGTTIILASVTFKNNDHSRAQGLAGSVFSILHSSMLGDLAATVSGLSGFVRGVIQGMIPDARTDARTASAIIGATVGAGVFALSNQIFPLMRVENIPMVAAVLFAVGGAFPKHLSWLSRLTGTVGCASFIPYHLSRVDMSMPSLVLAVGMTVVLLGAIGKNDILPHLRGKEDAANNQV